MLDGLLEDISGEGLSVPVVLVLDIGEVLSFEGLGDDAGWLVGLLSSLLEGTDNGLDVVTIDDVGLPSERVESLLVNLNIVSKTGLLGLSESVDIDDADEIFEVVVGCEVSSLPDGSLGALTVSENGPVGIVQLIEVLGGVGHSSGAAQSLSETSGGDVDERQLWSWVSLEVGVDLSEVEEVLLVDEPVFSPGGVEDWGGVSFAQDESVRGEGFLGVLGVVVHTAIVEE